MTALRFDADCLPLILEQHEIDALPFANWRHTMRSFVIAALNETARQRGIDQSYAWEEGDNDETSFLYDACGDIRAELRARIASWDPALADVIAP